MAEENILKVLKDLHISYEIQEHIPLFSEKDAQNVEITLQGIDVKNLFVKDKKGHYGLVSMDLHKRADLTKIAEASGITFDNDRNSGYRNMSSFFDTHSNNLATKDTEDNDDFE